MSQTPASASSVNGRSSYRLLPILLPFGRCNGGLEGEERSGELHRGSGGPLVPLGDRKPGLGPRRGAELEL